MTETNGIRATAGASGPVIIIIIIIDSSEIRKGKLGTAMSELVEFGRTNEPMMITYGVYLNDDATRGPSSRCTPRPHRPSSTCRWRAPRSPGSRS